MNDAKMKGIGIEMRRCSICRNLQEVLAIEGAVTLLFRCERCNKETYLSDGPETLIMPNVTLNTI